MIGLADNAVLDLKVALDTGRPVLLEAEYNPPETGAGFLSASAPILMRLLGIGNDDVEEEEEAVTFSSEKTLKLKNVRKVLHGCCVCRSRSRRRFECQMTVNERRSAVYEYTEASAHGTFLMHRNEYSQRFAVVAHGTRSRAHRGSVVEIVK